MHMIVPPSRGVSRHGEDWASFGLEEVKPGDPDWELYNRPRCQATGNPAGTDTRPAGKTCQCLGCRCYAAEERMKTLEARVKALEEIAGQMHRDMLPIMFVGPGR